jgi:hypothetical protein
MKTRPSHHIVAALICALGLLLPGCASTGDGGSSALRSELGPLVAEVAQARIAMRILDRSPERADTLLAIAATIEALSAEASGGEISEVLIRGWVAKQAPEWQLTAPEQALLVTGLLAARDTALRSTGSSTIKLGDPMLQPWLQAISRGIEAGVAAHRAK